MPEKLDLTRYRWILPYKTIAKKLAEKRAVTVTVSSEGEAFDLQVWARYRGFRVVKVTKYTGGIEVDLEAPAAPKARPAPARPEAAPQPAAKAEAAQAKPAAPKAAGVRLSPAIEKASPKLVEPLFKADLLLASKGARRFRVDLPAKVEKLASEAVKAAEGGCAVVSVTGVEGVNAAEMIVCGNTIHAAYVETVSGMVLGQKAVDALDEALSKSSGQAAVTVILVDKDFVEKVES